MQCCLLYEDFVLQSILDDLQRVIFITGSLTAALIVRQQLVIALWSKLFRNGPECRWLTEIYSVDALKIGSKWM